MVDKKDDNDYLVFLPPQWGYDARSLLNLSPDPAIDLAILTAAVVNRKYSGHYKDWSDFPAKYMSKKFKVSYARVKSSLERLVAYGLLDCKNLGVAGAKPKLYYRKRGEDYKLPAFRKLQEEEVEELIEEDKREIAVVKEEIKNEQVQTYSPPKQEELIKRKREPMPYEIHKEGPVFPKVKLLDGTEQMIYDLSHFVPEGERGGWTLNGQIYVDEIDKSGKPVWKNIPISVMGIMQGLSQCPRCGRWLRRDLFNADNICFVCREEL